MATELWYTTHLQWEHSEYKEHRIHCAEVLYPGRRRLLYTHKGHIFCCDGAGGSLQMSQDVHYSTCGEYHWLQRKLSSDSCQAMTGKYRKPNVTSTFQSILYENDWSWQYATSKESTVASMLGITY